MRDLFFVSVTNRQGELSFKGLAYVDILKGSVEGSNAATGTLTGLPKVKVKIIEMIKKGTKNSSDNGYDISISLVE